MLNKNNHQLERIFGQSLFQTRLLGRYHADLRDNPEKTIAELFRETLDSSDDIEESSMRVFTEASLLEHFYTSFVLCYELYKDTIECSYKNKNLSCIGINISTQISIEENHSYATKPVKDCLIFDFSRHLRNAVGHVNFEIVGSCFIFKDENIAKSQTFDAKFTIDEMKELLEKWQLFIIRNFIKTI